MSSLYLSTFSLHFGWSARRIWIHLTVFYEREGAQKRQNTKNFSRIKCNLIPNMEFYQSNQLVLLQRHLTISFKMLKEEEEENQQHTMRMKKKKKKRREQAATTTKSYTIMAIN